MTPEQTAAGCAEAVSRIASYFMLDAGTYAAGAEAGFAGIDFYVVGRGGALGEVDADVVTAAFALFEPSMVRANWEQGTKVLAPRDAATRFLGCGYEWATEHLDEAGCDWARLAELLGTISAAASPMCAPLFAAWRSMPEPGAEHEARALALHRLHVNRELRFARHAACLVANGLGVLDAMAVNRPEFIGLYGWTAEPPPVTDDLRARWEAAEAATNRALALDYATLAGGEGEELVALCHAAVESVR